MHEAAQAAYPVGNVYKVDKVPLFDQPLQSPVDIADGGNGIDNFFIFRTRSKWIGSGRTGCCGPKGITVLRAMIVPLLLLARQALRLFLVPAGAFAELPFLPSGASENFIFSMLKGVLMAVR